MVILGGIDLSIPFVIGFANVVAAQLYGQGLNFVARLLLVVGVLALGDRRVQRPALARHSAIHPLIVTLGTGMIVQGAVLLWTRGFPVRSAPPAVSSVRLDRRHRSGRCRCRGWCRALAALTALIASSWRARPTAAGSMRWAATRAPPRWR